MLSVSSGLKQKEKCVVGMVSMYLTVKGEKLRWTYNDSVYVCFTKIKREYKNYFIERKKL